jgi:CRISPR-associated protein Cas2
MQHLVVVYDIVDDKSRRIIGEILEGFGRRVNRSVFEIQVRNAKTRAKLEHALQTEIDPKHDSVRIYPLCANCMAKASVLGKEPDAFDKDAVYFF